MTSPVPLDIRRRNAKFLVKRRDQHEVPRDGERDPTRNAFDASVKFRSYFHDLATYPAKRTLAALSAFIGTYPANFPGSDFQTAIETQMISN